MFSLSRLSAPIIQAPMAGGPSTPELAAAVGEAGGLGFLAAGYLSAEALAEQIRAVRGLTERPFGVNVFVPETDPTDPRDLREYSRALGEVRARHGVEEAASLPECSDDEYAQKLDLLLEDPVPVVSFTFGLPETEVVRALQRQGSAVWVNATSPEEIRAAAALAPDAVIVQSAEAGGHRATHRQSAEPEEHPLEELIRAARGAVEVAVIAAGGIADPERVRQVLAAGADAAQVGTAFAVAEEAGTNEVHRRALVEAGAGGSGGASGSDGGGADRGDAGVLRAGRPRAGERVDAGARQPADRRLSAGPLPDRADPRRREESR